ncbi:PREDICTED: CASP-like protein 1F2 [Nicotiana attenuata]|uniref:CASP-like protein n=1 Tax=Nicotiana attenuata TaxID=49451 RepID=A0A1J6IWP9_NICAT|nr:PREDICTED: CASP-like protein 1F2 [Nicotiana attenuata]XP_019247361.1 PREDICTED: CASP-like protein 1F2 [Nicotiana attenuata]OIT02119.1 casp-like protein 1f1 [Nicotiana attenuata]
MENLDAKNMPSPPLKPYKCLLKTQIFLRILATAFTLASTWIILTSKQTVTVFGLEMDARYSYSPIFKFFAFANIIGCAFSVLSLFLASVLSHKCLDPKNYFYMFLHDLIVMAVLLAGCAAATAIGYVGKYGESHSGWMPICDHVSKFCHKVTDSVMLSYFAVLFYLCLAIISANQSRQIQV